MLEKVKSFFANQKAKLAAVIAGGATALTTSVSAFAAEGDGTDVTTGITTVFNTLKSSISITQVVAIIGISLATCVGLFLFWWGARYVVRKVKKAGTKGQVSV